MKPILDSDPRRLGSFTLRGRLGSGGMGVVYLGEGLDRSFAVIKTIRPDLIDVEHIRARFEREVRAAERVSSPHVSKVMDHNLEDDPPWYASEYIADAQPLDAVIANAGRLGRSRIEALASCLAAALASVHEEGIAHRDVKPQNILVAGDRFILIDFGIAKDELEGTLTVGSSPASPPWAAPEVRAGEPSQASADVYGWALTVLHAACGWPVQQLRAALSRAGLHDALGPYLGSLPQPIIKALEEALNQDPLFRPTARDVACLLPGTGVGKPTPLDAPTATPARVGRRTPVRAAITAVLALLIALGLAGWLGREADDATQVAIEGPVEPRPGPSSEDLAPRVEVWAGSWAAGHDDGIVPGHVRPERQGGGELVQFADGRFQLGLPKWWLEIEKTLSHTTVYAHVGHCGVQVDGAHSSAKPAIPYLQIAPSSEMFALDEFMERYVQTEDERLSAEVMSTRHDSVLFFKEDRVAGSQWVSFQVFEEFGISALFVIPVGAIPDPYGLALRTQASLSALAVNPNGRGPWVLHEDCRVGD